MTAEIKYTLEGDIGHYEHTISREEFIALETFDAVEIDCSDNQLASLPASLPKCKKLSCFNNRLTSLPTALPKCKELNCYYNRLASLPASLPKCKEFSCSNNQLVSLPELPECKELLCYHNQLTSLPELPKCKELYCSNNQLTSLPALLPKCKELYCSNNPLLPHYYPKTTQDLPRYHKLINAIEILQARFLLKQVLKGCPWHPLGKKHISEAWDAYNK